MRGRSSYRQSFLVGAPKEKKRELGGGTSFLG
jgi:hypothetical protein